MPELPEVETTRRTLWPALSGRPLLRVETLWAPVLTGEGADAVSAALAGAAATAMVRRGKFLGLAFERGPMLGIHLRMTGRLQIAPAGAARSPYLRAALSFGPQPAAETAPTAAPEVTPTAALGVASATEPCELHFVDVRKFGRLYWLPDGRLDGLATVRAMGPEPLGGDLTVSYLQARLRGRTAPIKALLLDQRLIAGIGNIYADEALFAAGIAPTRPAGKLRKTEIERLVQGIKSVLQKGIDYGGTTIRDYVNGLGDIGHMQEQLLAYGKEGEPCPNCGRPLQRRVVAGRSSFHCRACQK